MAEKLVDDYNATGTFVKGKFVPYDGKNKPPSEAMNPASMAPDDPFASLPAGVQQALAEAGVATLEEAQALGKDGLVALKGIGDKSAQEILDLQA